MRSAEFVFVFEVKLVTTVTATNKTITKRKYPYKKTPQNAPLESALSVKGGLVNLAPRCLGVGDATVPIYLYILYIGIQCPLSQLI